jgi:diadenosine tetraphosphatase ApaH/serine/threonine PP2A family protein phosphatase
MKALISDIHSNVEALKRVLDDAMQQRAEQIYCLGDLVGYGPNPRECLDLLMDLKLQVILRGNHDDAVINEPEAFKPAAERALHWTRRALEADSPGAGVTRRHFLQRLPFTHTEQDLLFVHASPRDPLNEYVHPQHARDPGKMGTLFWLVKRCCFMGHTHVPGIFVEDRHQYFHPADIGDYYRLGSSKVMCNVGSVGQPRDGDNRACYVLFDGDTIFFRRVEYDMAATRKKVRTIPDLDWSCWK